MRNFLNDRRLQSQCYDADDVGDVIVNRRRDTIIHFVQLEILL